MPTLPTPGMLGDCHEGCQRQFAVLRHQTLQNKRELWPYSAVCILGQTRTNATGSRGIGQTMHAPIPRS